jgi:hypothetical protein
MFYFFLGGGGWLVGGGSDDVSFSLHWTTSHEGQSNVAYVCECVRMSSRPTIVLNKVSDLVECSIFSKFFTPSSFHFAQTHLHVVEEM